MFIKSKLYRNELYRSYLQRQNETNVTELHPGNKTFLQEAYAFLKSPGPSMWSAVATEYAIQSQQKIAKPPIAAGKTTPPPVIDDLLEEAS